MVHKGFYIVLDQNNEPQKAQQNTYIYIFLYCQGVVRKYRKQREQFTDFL